MTCLGAAALCDVFGGFLVYRNLIPADARLSSIGDLRTRLGLDAGKLPRKAEPEYAAVVGEILRDARRVTGMAGEGARLIYVGDTRHNDVAAFTNICRVTGWTGRAFIADEGAGSPREVRQLTDGVTLTVSDQWADVAPFAANGYVTGFGCDEDTIVVVDIDKTLLGARGRNDQVIDRARQDAAYEVALDVAGEALANKDSFARIYDTVNSPAFHRLTGDNQDAVAYTSLLVACGLFELDDLAARVACGWIEDFRAFVCDVARRRSELPGDVARLQDNIRGQVEAGNPTPFAAFRRAEYRCTVARMGCLPDEAAPGKMLDEEIVITREVWESVQAWKTRGAALFGLSDKPDEACFPPADNADTENRPIHETRTHIVGGRE